MIIKIFDNEKTADRYTVFIEDIQERGKMHAFHMSSNAIDANGVNMCADIDYDKFVSDYENRKTEIFSRDSIEFGVLLAIARRIQQMQEEMYKI